MTYVPASVSASAGTDSAAGTISRTIAAAGAAYSQSSANALRSSIFDAYATLRAKAVTSIGKSGGGYRPLTALTTIQITGISPTGSTIPAAGVLYDQADEDEFRANMGTLINDLVGNLNTATFITGPRGAAYTHLTDSSGGTPGSLAASAAVYNQTAQNNMRATLAAKLEAIANAMGV